MTPSDTDITARRTWRQALRRTPLAAALALLLALGVFAGTEWTYQRALELLRDFDIDPAPVRHRLERLERKLARRAAMLPIY